MEIIEQVRGAAGIVELAGQYTTLRQRGRKYVGLCPFHAEKTPSFTVDAEKGLYHCFGCGVGGDVFSLVMEKENLNFAEALKYLAERYHIPLPNDRRLSPRALKLEDELRGVMESALAFFQKSLRTGPEGKKAQDYLAKRGVPESLIETFRIGYAPNSWNALTGFFKAKGVPASLLEKAGLALPGRTQGEFYDRFRGRVIFPIFTLTGKVVAFGGRSLYDQEPKYLNSPDTSLYSKGRLLYGLQATKEAVREAGEFILVEGYTDFLALYQAGLRNVVASLGTALTPHQVDLAMRFAPRAVVSYDGDAAGRTAAFRAVPLFLGKGVEVRVVTLPGSEDPDGFIRNHGREAFDRLLSGSSPGWTFIIDHSLREKRMSVPEVKTRVLRSILDILDVIPDVVARSEYLKQTSERLNVEESLIRSLSRGKQGHPPAEARGAFLPAEKRLLRILLESEDLRPLILAEVKDEDIRGLKSEPVLRIIIDLSKKDRRLPFHELQKAVGPPLAGELSRLLQEAEGPVSAEEAFDCLCALQVSCKEGELRRIQAEIAREEKSADPARLTDLMTRKQDLTRQIIDLK